MFNTEATFNLLTEALRIEREKTARRCAEIADAEEIRREFGLDQGNKPTPPAKPILDPDYHGCGPSVAEMEAAFREGLTEEGRRLLDEGKRLLDQEQGR